MPRKILITGGAGRLAGRLAAYFNAQRGEQALAVSRRELDVTDRAQAESCLDAFKPDVVVNTAALLTEPCESDIELAYRINAWGARTLALACERRGVLLAHISTSGLFGDEIKAYSEYDPVVLKTAYARSKFAGEGLIRRFCPKHVILRLGWLYGSGLDGKPDFVTARIKEAQGRDVLECAGDKHGTPVFADDAAALLDRLLQAGESGTFHAACEGEPGCTRAEYVRAILEAAGMDAAVKPVDSGMFSRMADVPDCEMLAGLNLAFAGVAKAPPWRERLQAYVFELKERGQ
jgi:dTDP-4-dehydrorhamnose reductase